jgi:hypothetical protein
MEKRPRTGYPGDGNHKEWASVAPDLTLRKQEAEQREDPLLGGIQRGAFQQASCRAHNRCRGLFAVADFSDNRSRWKNADRERILFEESVDNGTILRLCAVVLAAMRASKIPSKIDPIQDSIDDPIDDPID